MVHARRQSQIAITQATSRRQQHIALAKVETGTSNMPPSHRRLGDAQITVRQHCVLLNDNGVGSVRDDAAGEDPDRLTATNSAIERAAGGDLTDDL